MENTTEPVPTLVQLTLPFDDDFGDEKLQPAQCDLGEACESCQ